MGVIILIRFSLTNNTHSFFPDYTRSKTINAFTTKNPQIVAKMLPPTWPKIISPDQKNSYRKSKEQVSAENAEKVVRPPRNPVVIHNRDASDSINGF